MPKRALLKAIAFALLRRLRTLQLIAAFEEGFTKSS
jgi:hypothetical protein